MRLQRLIPWLAALLVFQLVLALLLWGNGRQPEPRAADTLLVFDHAAVDGIEIDDGKQTLRLRKTGGRWLLPELFDFPAAAFRVDGLLNELAALKTGLAVANSDEAAERFRVADKAYERRIRLLSGDTALATLYLGDAAGPRRAYGRVGGGTAVYPLEFTTFQADAASSGWTDKTWLHRQVSEVSALRVGDIQLQREGEDWRLADLAEGEAMDQDAAAALVARLAGLNFMAVAGPAQPAPTGKSLLDAELTLTDGKPVQYRFTDPGQGGDPLLWVSDRDQLLRIASFTFKPLAEVTRAQLIGGVAPTAPAE